MEDIPGVNNRNNRKYYQMLTVFPNNEKYRSFDKSIFDNGGLNTR